MSSLTPASYELLNREDKTFRANLNYIFGDPSYNILIESSNKNIDISVNQDFQQEILIYKI